MWKWVVLALGSLALSYLSRNALRKPGSHGFYRFFAWELMLALLLLNVSHWFSNWSAWYQVVSWSLLFVCLVPLVFGVSSLSTRGRRDERQRTEPELLGFERTTRLVTDGIYRYIRHPLYSSLLILNWGIFFKQPSWVAVVLALGASLLLLATARADEAECTQTFGADYRQYMQHTRMFIPYLF